MNLSSKISRFLQISYTLFSKWPIILGVNTTLGRFRLQARLSHHILWCPSSTTSSNCHNYPPYRPKFYTTLIEAIKNLDYALFIVSSLCESHPHYFQNHLSSKESTPLEGNGGFQRRPVTVYYHISNPNSTLSSNWHNFHPYHPKIYKNCIQTIPKTKQLSLTTPSD